MTRSNSISDDVTNDVWTGCVRSELAVPVGEVIVLDAGTRRIWARRRVHVPFWIELDDGTALPVEPSKVQLPDAKTTKGTWEGLRSRFGSFFVYPEARKTVWRGWLELHERLVCNGDRVRLQGELFRGPPTLGGYRATSPRPEAIRGLAIEVTAPVPRERSLLGAVERSRYGVTAPKPPGVVDEPALSVPAQALDALVDMLDEVGAEVGELFDVDWD